MRGFIAKRQQVNRPVTAVDSYSSSNLLEARTNAERNFQMADVRLPSAGPVGADVRRRINARISGIRGTEIR